MRYFYDTEFIERGHRFPVDLISIGIAADDGREYYAISTEFNARKASQWVKDNVLIHLPPRNPNPAYESPRICHEAQAWKKRAQIKTDLLSFCDPATFGPIELWGYYGAYDHVVLCQLFGTMIDLPRRWPMYTNDIVQLCDSLGNPPLPSQTKDVHHALADARWHKELWEYLMDYKQRNGSK